MPNIAIIDDDVYIGNMLEEILQREGYQVTRAYSGTEAIMLLSNSSPDLILLDLMLPGIPGEEVLAKIHGIPVIVLSAKNDVADKVDMLLGGAVDYMTKPFDTNELLARITVHLRRANVGGNNHIITCGDISLDTDLRSVTVSGQGVHLTKTEYAILKLLMRNMNHVLTKSQILDGIFEDTPDCVESSLKVHISNLRKKLREYGGKDYIESVWGIGFKMHIE